MNASNTRSTLLGCWKLTKFQVYLGDESDALPLTQPHGTETFGRIMFSESGWMSASLTPPERAKKLSTPDWMMASDEDILWVARAYTSYMGPFKVYEKDGESILECNVEIALDPSWIGSLQKRRLTLSERNGKKLLTLRPTQFLILPVWCRKI